MLLSISNGFVEQLLPYEREYFLWLNQFRSDFWDAFMWLYSDKFTWIPLALIMLGVFIYRVHWKEILLLILAAVLIGVLCDYVSAQLIKPYFSRLRPTHHPDFANYVDIVRNYRGGRLGFISNHAANGFGIAIFASLLFRYRYLTIAIYLWVITTVYSRIYLGVHFITDILGGLIWGTLVGLGVYYLYIYSRKKFLHIPSNEACVPVLGICKAKLIILAITLTVVTIGVYSFFFQFSE